MAPRQSAQLAAAAAAGIGLGIIATLSFQRGARREPDEDDVPDLLSGSDSSEDSAHDCCFGLPRTRGTKRRGTTGQLIYYLIKA